METVVSRLKYSLSLGFGADIDSEMIACLNQEQEFSEKDLGDFGLTSSAPDLNQLQQH